jgi:hypothetical protein
MLTWGLKPCKICLNVGHARKPRQYCRSSCDNNRYTIEAGSPVCDIFLRGRIWKGLVIWGVIDAAEENAGLFYYTETIEKCLTV